MRLKEVFIMVSGFWATWANDDAFKRRPIYEAIVCKQTRKSMKFLENELSPESLEFAKARIREIHL